MIQLPLQFVNPKNHPQNLAFWTRVGRRIDFNELSDRISASDSFRLADDPSSGGANFLASRAAIENLFGQEAQYRRAAAILWDAGRLRARRKV